jgi:hypothetical protein
MMTLLDIPRCLKVETSYVGPPSEHVGLGGDRRSIWTDATNWGGTAAYRELVVQECFDTAAILHNYRAPLEGESWLIPAESERRLLAQVNAIIALGRDSLEQVIAQSLDPDVPDPGHVFAALLVLGCVEGREWLISVRDIFVAAAVRDQAELAAAVEALCLSPHQELSTILVPLLDHERSRVRAGAVRVLAYHNELTESAWNNAMHDSSLTVVEAATSVPLRSYDRRICERALLPLFKRHKSPQLVRLALRAGVSLRLSSAYDYILQIIQETPLLADAAYYLAMFGQLTDARYIRDVLVGLHPQDGMRGAGVLGSIELVPDLINHLDRNDLNPEAGKYAKQVLADITGLAFDTTKTAVEARRLWTQHSSKFEPHIRYRNGHPWSLGGLIQSLRTGPGSREFRQSLYHEMLSATESRVPHFSPYDFVGVQMESLHHIEHWLAEPEHRPNFPTNLASSHG